MKITVFETQEWEHAACLQLGGSHEVTCWKAALNAQTVEQATDAQIITTFVHSQLDASVLSRLPQLRLIATRSTGCDHIDLAWTAVHGITVCNVQDYGDHVAAAGPEPARGDGAAQAPLGTPPASAAGGGDLTLTA